MPVELNKDSKGSYYRWGKSGHKYYYIPNNTHSRNFAKRKQKTRYSH